MSGLLPLLGLRERYLLTRTGRLRVRYVALPSMVLCLFITMLVLQFLSSLNARQYHLTQPLFTAAVRYDVDPAQIRQNSQKRLHRYAQPDEKASTAQNVAAANPPPSAGSMQPREKTIVVAKGETMAGILQKAGLDGTSSYQALDAMSQIYNPRMLRAGQMVSVGLNPSPDGNGYVFSRLAIDIDPLQTLHMRRTADGSFSATLDKKETLRRQHAKQADIQLSLYGSALAAGIPPAIVASAIRIFSWDVDFQRDIRQGDVLDVMYDQVETRDGTLVESGDILYARLNVNGQGIPLYRFETADGSVDYYTPDGVSIRKALMTTPVDGARLSSGFGMRKHPILGYSKMHKGTDFAAPSGTPIYAAGDGAIEKIGRNGAYGNYIRLRHNSTLKTAYAHMSKFAKNLAPGSRVKQGQVIGYIGTTGRSTGPHLHYEVLVNGAQVNPRNVKMQQGDILEGKQLAAFRNHIEHVNRQYAALIGGIRMASAETRAPNLR